MAKFNLKVSFPMCCDPKLHIVTHCYAVELPQYAMALRYQLSSLVLHPPKTRTLIEVCCVEEDKETMEVIDWFACNTNLYFCVSRLTLPQISRRSIGRNIAALRSHAELVWFTDVDHIFGLGCIDSLWREWESTPYFVSMIYSKSIQINETHATGDQYLSTLAQELVDIDPIDFTDKFYDRAIGGVQIVPGSLARQYGYLNHDPRYQTPLEKPFSSFQDDVAYRRWCGTKGPVVAVNIKGLYRIRHSRTTYQPDKVQPHGAVFD